MNWTELKRKYTEDHLQKKLKAHKVRLNALKAIEKNLENNFPEFLKNPSMMLSIEKKEFKMRLAKYKNNGKLNGAEESVVNGLYKFLN